MPSRFGLLIEGVLVLAILIVAFAIHYQMTHRPHPDLGLELYYSLGERTGGLVR